MVTPADGVCMDSSTPKLQWKSRPRGSKAEEADGGAISCGCGMPLMGILGKFIIFQWCPQTPGNNET